MALLLWNTPLPAATSHLSAENFPINQKRNAHAFPQHHFASFLPCISARRDTAGCCKAKSEPQELSTVPRPSQKFSPTIWGQHFASIHDSEFKSYAGEVEVLKESVRQMLTASTGEDPMEKVKLIDSLYRLGVSYYFETEIEEQLNNLFHEIPKLVDSINCDDDLLTASILFQVFRRYGYRVPCETDMFNKFKDNDGKFKESLTRDVKGMLSLYEATHLRISGEDILEEAHAFTKSHLKSMALQCPPHLRTYIISAFDIPYHKGLPRIEARKYISFYQEDESRNEMLLKFAKLEFNLLQLLHKQELSHLSSWWNELNLASELFYARNRLVEMYLWAIGIYHEPQYSRARMMLAKFLTIYTFIDDTYDAYGTLEELQSFTDAMQRWDINCVDQLPDYMKTLYKAILNLIHEFETDMYKEGRSYSISHFKDELKRVMEAYLVEAQWLNKGYVPSFDESMEIERITVSINPLTSAAYLGMGDLAGIQAYQWLKSQPKIVSVAETTCRLMGDIVSHTEEQKRGHVASTVECYMKQYGVSEIEVIEEFRKKIVEGWKHANEETMRPTAVPRHLWMRVLNFLRIGEVFYGNADGIVHPEYLKDHITALFMDPIPI